MNLRKALLIIFLFLLFGGVFYKYQEWSTLRRMTNSYEKSFIEELVLAEESSRLGEDVFEKVSALLSEENLSHDEMLVKFDAVISSLETAKDKGKEYYEIVSKNQKLFQQSLGTRIILFGSARKFSHDFLQAIDVYYREEIESARQGLVDADFFLNLFKTLRDYQISQEHSRTTNFYSKSDIYDSFGDISSLEKYSRRDFSFDNQEEIKNRLPYGYEVLERYKDYLASYYLVVKDYVKEDYESAAYKSRKLQKAGVNLAVDWDRLFEEGKEERIARAKAILEHMADLISYLREFEVEGTGEYPFLDNIAFSKYDLLLCHFYIYKADHFEPITSEFPKSQTPEELITELSAIAPKTPELDASFDMESMELTNTEEAITYVCRDKSSGDSYTFKVMK